MKARHHRCARLAMVLVCVLARVAVAAEFADGFAAGELDRSLWQLDSKGECTVSIAAPDGDADARAAKFVAGRGSRCELTPKMYHSWIEKFQNEPFNEERWYVFSTYLEGPWEPYPKNEIIAQWHGNRDKLLGDLDGRGPPLAIRIYGNEFRITSGADPNLISSQRWIARNPLWIAPVVTGRWMHWRIQARWSWEDDGLLRIWVDDQLVVDHSGPNTYNDLRGVYLKLGPYHPMSGRTMYLDEVSIGGHAPRAARP